MPKEGDLVRDKRTGEVGLFIGLRTFRACGNVNTEDYTCSEVMWLNKTAPNGDAVSTIQSDLIEVANECN